MIRVTPILSFISLLFSLFVYSQENNTEKKWEPSLCKSNEVILASCPLRNNKYVSFCSLSNGEFAQYRYGSLNNIELSYPKIKKKKNNDIFFVDDSDASAGNLYALVFYIGDYRYSYHSWGGVEVRKKKNGYKGEVNYNTRVFSQRCKSYYLSDEELQLIKETPRFPINPDKIFPTKSKFDY